MEDVLDDLTPVLTIFCDRLNWFQETKEEQQTSKYCANSNS